MIRSVRRPCVTVAALLFITPAVLLAQDVVVTGTLAAVWGDPHPSSAATPELRWSLADDRGRVMEVAVNGDAVRRAGGIGALDRRRVTVRGTFDRGRADRSGPTPVLRATGLRAAAAPTAGLHAPPRLGSRPYAVLLCGFADIAAEPRPTGFFDALMGDDYPGLGHYYGEASGGRMDLAGTRAFGWFTLPRDHAAYFDSETGAILLYRLADDCVAAADPVVDFAAFSGIIIQVNGQLSLTGYGMAWGGSHVVALDGPARVWPFMWMPLWAMAESRYGIYTHELGHSLGLPHSSGPFGTSYDSSWDVMSRPYLRWDGDIGGWIPGGTIAFHKDLLGWVPDAHRVTVREATGVRIRLDSHTPGSPGDGARLVRIPIPGTPDFYTVEARRRAGYDQAVPGEAVVLHRVPDPDGPGCSLHRCAEVIDHSGTGDPNGPGAMWLPGETFDDGTIRVTVAGATDTGWELVVSVTAPPAPAGLTPDRAADGLFRAALLNADEREYLDAMGNRNGRYDLGDFLAFIRRQDP